MAVHYAPVGANCDRTLRHNINIYRQEAGCDIEDNVPWLCTIPVCPIPVYNFPVILHHVPNSVCDRLSLYVHWLCQTFALRVPEVLL